MNIDDGKISLARTGLEPLENELAREFKVGRTSVRERSEGVAVRGGSRTTVVWNPWIDKARQLADFGDDEYRGMICVETATAFENAVTLGAGASHVMSATVEVQPLELPEFDR